MFQAITFSIEVSADALTATLRAPAEVVVSAADVIARLKEIGISQFDDGQLIEALVEHGSGICLVKGNLIATAAGNLQNNKGILCIHPLLETHEDELVKALVNFDGDVMVKGSLRDNRSLTSKRFSGGRDGFGVPKCDMGVSRVHDRSCGGRIADNRKA